MLEMSDKATRINPGICPPESNIVPQSLPRPIPVVDQLREAGAIPLLTALLMDDAGDPVSPDSERGLSVGRRHLQKARRRPSVISLSSNSRGTAQQFAECFCAPHRPPCVQGWRAVSHTNVFMTGTFSSLPFIYMQCKIFKFDTDF